MITCLVVDDDPRVADIHAAYVSKVPGFTVLALAHNAADAFMLARTAHPDLLLLDLYLPDEHGLDLLARLQHDRTRLLDTIVITASKDVRSVRDALQLGVLQYVVKPFGSRQLTDRLQAYKELRQSLREMRDATQSDVDKVFGLSREQGHVLTARAEPTMSTVLDAVAGAPGEITAAQVAASVGISRPTAQRYLARLVDLGLLRVSLQYGAAGRPTHLYRASRPVPPGR